MGVTMSEHVSSKQPSLTSFFSKYLRIPELSYSTNRMYKYLGSQIRAILSSERSKTAVKVSQP